MCGQKPAFSILMEHFIQSCVYAALQGKAHRGIFAFCHLIFAAIDTMKGSAVGL